MLPVKNELVFFLSDQAKELDDENPVCGELTKNTYSDKFTLLIYVDKFDSI